MLVFLGYFAVWDHYNIEGHYLNNTVIKFWKKYANTYVMPADVMLVTSSMANA
jgi:hypothetical protein